MTKGKGKGCGNGTGLGTGNEAACRTGSSGKHSEEKNRFNPEIYSAVYVIILAVGYSMCPDTDLITII